MGLSDDGEQDVRRRYEELCRDLNMDSVSAEEAWQSYESISQNYTLEGDQQHWLACALYVACRSSSVPTVGRAGAVIEGNCVSLTRLLRSCRLSLIQFFNKMKKWVDMANLPQDFRGKVERLERNFAVSTVIFKKFEPIYVDIFKDPSEDGPRQARSRKHKRPPCTSSEVFAFAWTLFIQVKGNFPAISDDLVNSYHLLLSCIDLCFGNALIAERRDILNCDFTGLPSNFHQKDYRPAFDPPCIIELLCNKHDGLVVEAKTIKEHWWKPFIKKLSDKKVLKIKLDNWSGVLDQGNFEYNSKLINKEYEEYVLNVGDFDERIFLEQDASVDIGTPAKVSDLAEKMRAKKNSQLQQHLDMTKTLAPSTPLTGRGYLKNKEGPNITPVSTATQSVSKLQALLSGRKTQASDQLIDIFKECSRNPLEKIVERVRDMGNTFCEAYAKPSEDHPGSHNSFAKNRLQLGECLYYKTMENVLTDEMKRLPANVDLSSLLDQEMFHRSMFACCLEIVIFSYNSQRTFPWIIEVFNLDPFYFYKVIEILIRAEEGLSRDVVKHLNLIEEQVLESLAWRFESPLWDAIRESGQPIPSCEDVSLPSQIETGGSSTNSIPPDVMNSPSQQARVIQINRVTPQDYEGDSAAARSVVRDIQKLRSQAGAWRSIKASLQESCSAGNAIIGENGMTYIPRQTLTIAGVNAAGNSAVKLNVPKKAKKPGSLGLFFRKFYHLASVRLRDLCDKLDIKDDSLIRKMWTCFEHCIINDQDLMKDRHVDQIIMCTIYVVAKVTGNDKTFQDVMKCYRMQPQAYSHVYRSVLLCNRKRRSSGSSEGSKNDSNSPLPEEEEKEKVSDDKRKQALSIRSSSTLPVPHPSSQPPTPTRLSGTATSFEFEDRGDLIRFYNTVFVQSIQKFALKFSTTGKNVQGDSPMLSPLPMLKAHAQSPRRRVSTNHSLYISPLKHSHVPMSPNRPLSYSFSKSPAKDLRAINYLIKKSDYSRVGVGKRILQDDESEDSSNNKRLRPDLTTKKLQDVINDRQASNVSAAEPPTQE